MENLNTLPISMESDALSALKSDMDTLITQTISSMKAWNNKEGVINVKLTIKLNEDLADDGKGGMRPVVVPRFEHKVAAVLQAKAERKGSTTDEYKLVWDEEGGQYVMVRKANNQTSIFDDKGNNGFDYEVFGGHLEAGGEVTEAEDDDDLPFEDDEDGFDNEFDDSDNEDDDSDNEASDFDDDETA